MKQARISRLLNAAWILALGAMLTGCTVISQATPTAVKSAGSVYTSKTLTTSHEGALDASNQLALGMLKLEGTENAITAEQAKSMLRVMQALQGSALKADAERNAVWAYVEAQLTPAQSSAIAAMRLAQNDLQTWLQNNAQPGTGPQGMPPAGQGPSGSRPQRAPGAGQAQGGGARPQGTPGARQGSARQPVAPGDSGATSGQSNVLLPALIRLLTSKTGPAAPPPGGPAATPAPAKP